MDNTLGYLLEALSNYAEDHSLSKKIYQKLETTNYTNEEMFIRSLEEEEIELLNKILPNEITYAMEEKDYKRMKELNEVYVLLY